jgi:hypothetical protein
MLLFEHWWLSAKPKPGPKDPYNHSS